MPQEVGDALKSVLKRLRCSQQLLPEEKVLATDWEESKVPITVELVGCRASYGSLQRST